MSQALAEIGRKGLALAVLLVVTWLLLKLVIGVVTTIAWIVVVVVGLAAVVWAVSVLGR